MRLLASAGLLLVGCCCQRNHFLVGGFTGALAGLFFCFGGILPVFSVHSAVRYNRLARGELALQFAKAGALATSATRRIS